MSYYGDDIDHAERAAFQPCPDCGGPQYDDVHADDCPRELAARMAAVAAPTVAIDVSMTEEDADSAADVLRMIAAQIADAFTSGHDSRNGNRYAYEVRTAGDPRDDVLDTVRAELYEARAQGQATTPADYAADVVARLVRAYDLGAIAAALAEDWRDAATAELVAAVEAAGIEPADLDDAVHDAGSMDASDANNGGTDAQVAHLVARFGVSGARQVIEHATGRPLPTV